MLRRSIHSLFGLFFILPALSCASQTATTSTPSQPPIVVTPIFVTSAALNPLNTNRTPTTSIPTLAAPTLVPTSVAARPDWTVTIGRLLEGEEAYSFINSSTELIAYLGPTSQDEAERGWKYIALDMAFESGSAENWLTTSRSEFSILDSTDTWRDGELQLWIGCGLGIPPTIYSLPGIRLRAVGFAKIPEKASFKAARIVITEPDRVTPMRVFNLYSTAISNEPVNYPFEELAGDVPLFDQLPVMEVPGVARLTFSNIRTAEGSYETQHIEFDVEIENLTSDNITTETFENFGAVVVDDQGFYYATSVDFHIYDLEDDILPPTYTETVKAVIGMCNQQKDFNILWGAFGILTDHRYYSEHFSEIARQFVFRKR